MEELSSRLRHTSALLVWQLNRKNRGLEEATILEKHTLKNKDIIKHLLHPIEPYIMYHHDRFDAITNDRPHRKKYQRLKPSFEIDTSMDNEAIPASGWYIDWIEI